MDKKNELRNFGYIIKRLVMGKRVRRLNWPEGDFIFLRYHGIHFNGVTEDYSTKYVEKHFKGVDTYERDSLQRVSDKVFIETFVVSTDDIFACDWQVLD